MRISMQKPLFVPLVLGLAVACGPPPASGDQCIPTDELLGNPAERLWCGGLWKPQDDPDLIWKDEPAGAGGPVCLPPRADGSCQTCPIDEVAAAVEAELNALYPVGSAECQVEHWEIGCLRNKENTEKSLGITDDYCCFEVALWGPGCDDLD